MTKEIRVFIADPIDYYMDLDVDSNIEDIMDCAEAQGTVYSLSNFLRKFNLYGLQNNYGLWELKGENVVMKMAEFKDGQFVRELGIFRYFEDEED